MREPSGGGANPEQVLGGRKQAEQATGSKPVSVLLCASASAPALTALHGGLQLAKWNKPFPYQADFGHGLLSQQ